MEDFYRLDPAISCSGEIAVVPASSAVMEIDRRVDNMFQFEADEQEMSRSEISSLIKDQIANHPRYPNLVTAYIECRKVGASPKMASLLEKIARENNPSCCSSAIGADPELDKFMDSYCEVLHRYKEELSKQFDEASSFLSNIKVQLSDLCKVASSSTTTTSSSLFGNSQSDEAPGTSEEELSCGEVEVVDALESCGPHPGDEDLKEMLLRKYSGYLSSLRKEFMRNRKKGKLPTDARMVLLDWWNCHYKWPYPSEEEKIQLSEASGLDYKQINNWFINQRKRHWKPSEDIRFALVDHIAGDSSEPQIHQRNWQ